MTIAQADRIDGLGINRQTGELVLLVSDHLRWDDLTTHIAALETKLAAYLSYIRSNQHQTDVPESRGMPVRISLVCEHQPTAEAEVVLRAVSEQLQDFDIRFSRDQLSTSH